MGEHFLQYSEKDHLKNLSMRRKFTSAAKGFSGGLLPEKCLLKHQVF